MEYDFTVVMPLAHKMGHNVLMAVVCLSVSPSVCPVPDHKSRMKSHSEFKFGRKESHDTGDL